MAQESRQPNTPKTPLLNVWGLAGELGLIIAIPLVILVLVGIKIDKTLGTTPLFIIAGIVLSFIASSVSIARKIKKISA